MAMAQVTELAAPAAGAALADEIAAATDGAAIVDRSRAGRLRIVGSDALDLMNRLSTNDLSALPYGEIVGTVMTTNKGRVIDLLTLARQGDHILALTGPDTRGRVMDWIDFYTFAEDVAVEDVTESTAMLSLVGAGAVSLLPSLADLPRHAAAECAIDGVDALALRTDFVGAAAFDLVADAADGQRLRDAMTARGATPVGDDAIDIVRMRRGVPASGRELTEDRNPLEANLTDYISFNKGCYIGQEVVARLNTYKKAQRRLARLSWRGEAPPERGAKLYADGKRVGEVTSAAAVPPSGEGVGLGYIRKAQARPGIRLETDCGADVAVEEVLFRYA